MSSCNKTLHKNGAMLQDTCWKSKRIYAQTRTGPLHACVHLYGPCLTHVHNIHQILMVTTTWGRQGLKQPDNNQQKMA